ncbi:universal stress protein [Dactylosporangium sp. NPDC000521]|uniref:universal stress protein n=1 Tax=Dactylosporangium sp. NPDC000521 TaxID=3363975 RepID=UPI0036A65438
MPARIRVVAGFDGSADGWAAARHAAAEATAGRGVVRLVHSQLDRVAYAGLLPPDLTADAHTEAWRLLDTVRDELAATHPGTHIEAAVVRQAPAAALVRVARSADLIVLGRRGHGRPPARGGAGRIHVGAVTAHVMAYASCPVLVVRAGDTVHGPVLLGLDAAAPSPAAIRHAFETAQRHGTGVRVCAVSGPDDPRDDAGTRLLLSRAIADRRAAHPDVAVALDALHGVDPAARLLDAARTASLVVVGAGEGTGTLVRNAPCPVAVVRGRDLGRPRAGRRPLGSLP